MAAPIRPGQTLMPPVPGQLLLDLSHSSHTRARTGVQRVSRAIQRELAGRAEAVCFDPYERAWRPLDEWERENLAAVAPSGGRGARWPLSARMRGGLRRLTHRSAALPAAPAGVLVPEIFSPVVAAALPKLFSASAGPRVCVFHDALALRLPEFTPRSTVARFPGYLRELLLFDGIAAVSEDSRASLEDYWRWLGVTRGPALRAIPLGIDPAPAAPPATGAPAVPTVLSVGSIEARKNHAALLDACESLWDAGAHFRLRIVGIANAETGGRTLARIRGLISAGRPLDYVGALGDDALEAAYRECAFTVYPSLAEGFGLPVAESLARGKPCLCRSDGALGEVSRGGGCVDIGPAGAADISAGMGRLLGSSAILAALAMQARGRTFKTWAEYTDELLAWMGDLRRDA
jgi:glycosyltransferase involved in cell wall biosynthesis